MEKNQKVTWGSEEEMQKFKQIDAKQLQRETKWSLPDMEMVQKKSTVARKRWKHVCSWFVCL